MVQILFCGCHHVQQCLGTEDVVEVVNKRPTFYTSDPSRPASTYPEADRRSGGGRPVKISAKQRKNYSPAVRLITTSPVFFLGGGAPKHILTLYNVQPLQLFENIFYFFTSKTQFTVIVILTFNEFFYLRLSWRIFSFNIWNVPVPAQEIYDLFIFSFFPFFCVFDYFFFTF